MLAEQPVSPVDHIAEYLVRFRGSGVLVAVENVVAEYAVGLVAVLGYGLRPTWACGHSIGGDGPEPSVAATQTFFWSRALLPSVAKLPVRRHELGEN